MAPCAQTRPLWRAITRCTVAKPIPVPLNSLSACRRSEWAEEPVRVVHVEPDAVVAHEDSGLARVLGVTELDPRVWLL